MDTKIIRQNVIAIDDYVCNAYLLSDETWYISIDNLSELLIVDVRKTREFLNSEFLKSWNKTTYSPVPFVTEDGKQLEGVSIKIISIYLMYLALRGDVFPQGKTMKCVEHWIELLCVASY